MQFCGQVDKAMAESSEQAGVAHNGAAETGTDDIGKADQPQTAEKMPQRPPQSQYKVGLWLPDTCAQHSDARGVFAVSHP